MSYKNFINIPIGHFRFSFYEIEPERVVVEYRQENYFFRRVLFLKEPDMASAYLNVLRFLRGEFLMPFEQLLLTEGKKQNDTDVIKGVFCSYSYEIKYLGLIENNVHSYMFSVPVGFDYLKKEIVYKAVGVENSKKNNPLDLKNMVQGLIKKFQERVRINDSAIYIW